MQPMNAQCQCGATRFRVRGKALFRGLCHCTICQQYNQAPYSDFSVFRTSDVEMPAEGMVVYKTYKAPPAMQRGVCASCGYPAVEYMQIGPFPKLILVPSANVRDESLVPDPEMHIFYEKRVDDMSDDLPRYSGYLKSQWVFMKRLVGALLRKDH